ncbi:hypothetical protein [Kitasatospora phosalacinea]|uniref:Uncharacterized protein n=1 Tax=Kitasatospora phosalacinea TaxID=2065 RepID=A0A9W6PL98_9ACTN|nr:hypothetical protein [Kitasatospora phosalacinea]GLW56948.1 hypothetical protein Kpho01_49590 [Kitasatospora phosalacinea]
MSRHAVRIAAAVAGLALAATAASATSATAAPAAGSVVIHESNSFFQQAARAGIVAVPLPTATAGYDAASGLSASFPVTDGSGTLNNFFGGVSLGGGLLFVDARTGSAVSFHQLAFAFDTWAVTAVPDGSTTPVALFDPAGNNSITSSGGTQSLTADALVLDAEGARYLDSELHTTFFTAGQDVGSFALSYTPAS